MPAEFQRPILVICAHAGSGRSLGEYPEKTSAEIGQSFDHDRRRFRGPSLRHLDQAGGSHLPDFHAAM